MNDPINTETPENAALRPAAVSEKVAAEYIGMSVSFLRQSRMEGDREGKTPGPAFVKISNRVLYRFVDLDQWLERYLRHPSRGVE